MSRHLLFILPGFLLAQWLTIGCIKPKNQSTVKEEATSNLGLDVNDISILFPLPSEKSEISKMLSLGFTNVDGKIPMDAALFADILRHHRYKADVAGKLTEVNSGARFDGAQREANEGRTFGPYNNIQDWRIVAMRFDPCAPSEGHNLQGHKKFNMPTSFDPKICLPQLRLVTQPILDASREQLEAFNGPVMASDYAIHMLFTLTESEVGSLYRELLAFRNACKDVTSSVPLGIHPCLQIAKNSGAYGGKEFEQLYMLIKSYARRLDGVAMMATQSGDDPWVFMNGTIKEGKFVHKFIDAVHENDSSKLPRGTKGNVIAPFGNGLFQQISFLELPDPQSRRGEGLPRPQFVSPSVQTSKANVFLNDELIASAMFGKSYDDAKQNEFYSLANKLENPLLVDFFSTDCVSCHAIASVTSGKTFNVTLDEKPELLIADSQYKSRDFIDFKNDPFQRFYAGDSFRPERSLTNIVEPMTKAKSGSGRRPTTFINFGYRGARPQVSQRAANESALVASLANRFFNNGESPAASCPTEELRQCITSLHMISHVESGSQISALSHCTMKLCQSRSNALSSLFGKDASRRYRLKADIMTKEPYEYMKPRKLKKGSEFVALIRKDPQLAEREPGFDHVRIFTPDVIEIETEDGQKAFIEARFGIYLDPSGLENLEILD